MNVKIKLLADVELEGIKHFAGSVLEVDEKTAKDLIGSKTAESHEKTAAADELKSTIKSAVREELDDSLAKAIEENPHFKLHDRSDDDPSGGYLNPGEEKDPNAVKWAMGQFAKEIYLSRDALPERLMKAQKRADDAVQKAAGDGQVVGRDADGGFTIPKAMNDMLLDAQLETAVVRPRATIIPIATNAIDLPTVDDSDHSGETVFGGVTATWESEEAEIASAKVKFENVAMKLKKLAVVGYATNEMLRWSPISIGGWLLPKFGAALAWKEDIGFIDGTGAGQPLGIRNSGDYLEVAKVSGQTNDTLVWLNIASMWAQNRGNDGSMFFVAHKTCFPTLSNMTVGDAPAWMPANMAQGRPNQTLMGLPLVYSEKANLIGDAGDITLMTGSQYLIADDQSGPQLAQSMHLKFLYDQMAFRITKHVDGQPASRTTFTDLQGSVFAYNTAVAVR